MSRSLRWQTGLALGQDDVKLLENCTSKENSEEFQKLSEMQDESQPLRGLQL